MTVKPFHSNTRKLFGLNIDVITSEQVVACVMQWCADGLGGFVVTPNLDHIRRIRSSPEFSEAYRRASLTVPDGKPLIWASYLDGGKKLHHVTGSGLIDPICRAAARAHRSIFVLGTNAETAALAIERLRRCHPGLQVAGTFSPPFGFDQMAGEAERCCYMIRQASPDILFVALGSPKQEIWTAEFFEKTSVKAALCIGGGIDMIAGRVPRSPPLMQRVGLEWLWRLAHEPRRLSGRYARIFLVLPTIITSHLLDIARDRWSKAR